MVASGNVEVINEKKEQLNTEKLYWNQKEGKIYSNDFVKITTQEEILMGEGFESNEDFTKYSIKKLKGTININENDSIQQGN
jgi:lipopolysaccharide assembly outer membrane protein LptD (OstA)